ncbi:MAG: 2-phosphosulfolactate phosphatase [Verrucomicrobia bacterium]|nr:2-phosphosulfolactate phosphatase [Verrucomicrobiota bacterium]
MTHVALCPSEIRRLSDTDLGGSTAVVFDVLRATSSMITGLSVGVAEIYPVKTVEEARAWKMKDPDLVLAGERGGLPLEGFDIGNSPYEFESLSGKRVVMTTTNGTVSIQLVRNAATVLIGSLLNIDSLAEHLSQKRPPVLLLVCAGTGEEFSLEDAIAAGALVSRLRERDDLTDAALSVKSLYERFEDHLEEWLFQTENARQLEKLGKGSDVHRCAQLSVYDVIGVLRNSAVVALRDNAIQGGLQC